MHSRRTRLLHGTIVSDNYVIIIHPTGQRPGIVEGNKRTRLGRGHLYFFMLFTNYSFAGYLRLQLLEGTMPKRKPRIHGLFLRVLHILGQENYCSWRTRLLQSAAPLF